MSVKLRICHVGHSDAHFIPPYVDYFTAQGYEVHLVTLHPDDVPSAIMHHAASERFDPMRDKLTYFWAMWRVRRILRELKPDLVHAHYLTSNAVMAAFAGCRPLVVSARGSDVHGSLDSPFKRRLITYAMGKADLVNVVSAELKEKVLSLGVPESRILLLTQGVEASRFTQIPRVEERPGPVRILCTRRLVPFFQGLRIVDAASALASRGVEFVLTFAARGDQKDAMVQRVERAGLQERVRFLDGYEQSALPALLAENDVYLSAAPWDGTSPALLEAMAAGLFPVVSDTPANREWLTGDTDALLFDWRSDEQMLRCLERACTEPALRLGCVEKNRGLVRRKGDRQGNLARLHEVYRQLMSGAQSGSESSSDTT